MTFLKNIFSKKEEPIQSYDDFWNWFKKNEKIFFKAVKEHDDIEQNFFNKLSPKLNEIKDGIYFLTGMSDGQTVELILTPDGGINNIVFVEELVEAAPKIDGWLFTALKPPSDIDSSNIEMAGFKFTRNNIAFYPNNDPLYPDEIDITVVYKDFNEDNKSTISHGTYLFLDNFLGEMNFAETIDSMDIIGNEIKGKELIPIEKLKDYLIWRQREFIEKYEGVRYDTENDTYSTFDAKLKNGNGLVAVIDTDLLSWDRKASHPWILKVEIKYDGHNNRGMPDSGTYKLLDEIENDFLDKLQDHDGYLNIGRQTADNLREIYFACKDFRKPSKILHEVANKYSNKLPITFNFYKDKYWRSFNRFMEY